MSQAQVSDHVAAIEAVVKTYLDGLYEGDVTKLGQAFHEACHLYSAGADGVADLPRAKWFELVASRTSPRAAGHARTDRIVSIDLSGPETAFVKLECSVPQRDFTDYLLLLKTAGGWQIVSKSFRAVARS